VVAPLILGAKVSLPRLDLVPERYVVVARVAEGNVVMHASEVAPCGDPFAADFLKSAM